MSDRISHSTAVPPVANGWPLDRSNVPPCPTCGTKMQDVPEFQINLVGTLPNAEGTPPVEIADVTFFCPGCHMRFHHRYQAPPTVVETALASE